MTVPLAHDPLTHPLCSVAADYAVSAWENVLVAYFPDRVTVPALAAVHGANLALLRDFPEGTATLAIVRGGMPMPRSDARAYAAKIGREASARLRGECIVIDGHPLWARTARTVLYTIGLVSTSLHPRGVFDAVDPACRWGLDKGGHTKTPAFQLVTTVEALIAANHRLR